MINMFVCGLYYESAFVYLSDGMLRMMDVPQIAPNWGTSGNIHSGSLPDLCVTRVGISSRLLRTPFPSLWSVAGLVSPIWGVQSIEDGNNLVWAVCVY